MKLSTLLLSSAALVVAGTAYAADLPAKKGAPAAKPATGCPAFGAGFFQIPGGDTCINFSGYMKYNGSYTSDSTNADTPSYTQAGAFRLNVDTRSNTEIGTVRGFGRLQSGALDKAYVQFSGVTAGQLSSLADIAGTNAENYGSNLGRGTTSGLQYAATLGAATLSIGLENADNNNSSGVADRPDVLLGLNTKAGPADVKIVAVSHEAANGSTTTQGYALIGRIGATLGGGFGAAVFGGTGEAANGYVGAKKLTDYDGTDKSKATNFGGEVLFSTGSGTFALAADQSEEKRGSSSTKVTNYGVSFVYNVTKGLAVEPEFVSETVDISGGSKTTSNIAYLRIQRDF